MIHSLESDSLPSCCATAIDEKASDAVSAARTNASTFRVAMLPLSAFSYNRLWAYCLKTMAHPNRLLRRLSLSIRSEGHLRIGPHMDLHPRHLWIPFQHTGLRST